MGLPCWQKLRTSTHSFLITQEQCKVQRQHCLFLHAYVVLSVKPYIINKDEFKNIVIKKNQTITLDIRYGGEPEPEVKWLKNGEEITPDGDR